MSADILAVEIAPGDHGATALVDGQRVEAADPAMLWRDVARRASSRLVQMLPQDAKALPEGQKLAAGRLRELAADAAFGQVVYADGKRSQRLSRVESLRYLDVAPGSILADPLALERAAGQIRRPWDDYWAHDLALALSWQGPVTLCDAILAELPTPALLNQRLPFRRASPEPSVDDHAPLILVYGRIAASVSLYFDGLPDDLRSQLRFLEPGDLFSDLTWLAAASLVVIVRGFEHVLISGAADLLEEIGTPMVWFTDDDFTALAGEVHSLGYYTQGTVKAFARRLAGIATTSQGLRHVLSAYHAETAIFPCVLDRHLWARRPAVPAQPPRAGAFGGSFRRQSFVRDIVPAAAALNLDMVIGADLGQGGNHVETMPFQTDFRSFIYRWQPLAPFAVLHPYGDTLNLANKSPASLLAAAYLGAVPVICKEPAYDHVGEAQGVLKADPDRASWQSELSRLLDEAARKPLARRFGDWAQTSFDPELARPAFAWLLQLATPGGEAASDKRLATALLSTTLQRALPRQPRWRKAIARLRLSLERRFAARRTRR